jgi:hypothetical protein
MALQNECAAIFRIKEGKFVRSVAEINLIFDQIIRRDRKYIPVQKI